MKKTLFEYKLYLLKSKEKGNYYRDLHGLKFPGLGLTQPIEKNIWPGTYKNNVYIWPL